MRKQVKYDPKYCEMLVTHMNEGLSFKAFAGLIKVNRNTLYEWVQKHDEFKEAKSYADDVCRLFWEKLGRAIALGQQPGASAAVWIYNMKCRFKEEWIDVQKNEHSGEGGAPLQIILKDYRAKPDEKSIKPK